MPSFLSPSARTAAWTRPGYDPSSVPTIPGDHGFVAALPHEALVGRQRGRGFPNHGDDTPSGRHDRGVTKPLFPQILDDFLQRGLMVTLGASQSSPHGYREVDSSSSYHLFGGLPSAEIAREPHAHQNGAQRDGGHQ